MGQLLSTVPNAAGLVAEKYDVQTWAYLGRYFGLKLQAAVALHTFRSRGGRSQQATAVQRLTAAQAAWATVCEITGKHLGQPELENHIFLLDYGEGYDKPGLFSWAALTPSVARDIEIAKAAPGVQHR